MDTLIRTPFIMFLVIFIYPAVFPWILQSLLHRYGATTFWMINAVIPASVVLLSQAYPELLLRYVNPRDAGGIRTAHLGYAWLLMSGAVFWIERFKMLKRAALLATSLVGCVVLLLGVWVA